MHPPSPRAATDALKHQIAGLTAQRLRLASGVVLFAFALTHFLNHALGLVSVPLMLAVQVVRTGFWQSLPGEGLLIGAALVHVVLSLLRTAERRTLAMPAWEAVQLVSGLAIPFLLVSHVMSTMGVRFTFGLDDDYDRVLQVMWPSKALQQTVLMALVWCHGCIGLHYWLRGRGWYRRSRPLALSLAIAVPLLAEWGWTDAARRIAAGIEPAAPVELTGAAAFWATDMSDTIRGLAALVLIAIVALVGLRRTLIARQGVIVTFPGGRQVRALPGATLLETARARGIPMASVCGGRARCSTCRTRVLSGAESLPPPDAAEEAVLARVRAAPGVRLACQITPVANLSVVPLLPVHPDAGAASESADAYHWGVEETVAILFVDMRGFTSLSERGLSFDIVYLLNRYLDAMAHEVRTAGGQVDKFIGDAVMAIFGIGSGGRAGSIAAMKAAAGMGRALDALNAEFAASLGKPLRIGIGIHAGQVILGRVGEAGGREAATITALGDAVNTASRLESMARDRGGVVVASNAVVRAAGLDPAALKSDEVNVRGRVSRLRVCVFASFADLDAALAAASAPALTRARAGSP